MESNICVWDLPLRLFHWLLVIAIVPAYVTGTQGGLWLDWHSHIGVTILTLIIFRIVWGFVGTTYARFTSFFPTPGRLRKYISSDWQGIGHNPVGSLSIIALLGITLMQAVSGLFSMNDEIEFYGPLYGLLSGMWSERLTSWHSQIINVLLIMIALHLIAIVYYTQVKHEKLLNQMISGKTRAVGTNQINGGGIIPFLFAISISVVVFWIIESGVLLRWLI